MECKMTETILKLARGLPRPLLVVSVVFFEMGLISAGVALPEARDYIFQALAGFNGLGGAIVIWWFDERKKRHENGQQDAPFS